MRREQEYLSRTQLSMQGGKAWTNLNRIAEALIKEHATSEKNAQSLTRIARLCNMDLAHLSRLIENKAGFVRIYRKNLGKPVRSEGLFFLVDPVYTQANAEGHYYPRNFAPILERMGVEGLLKSIVFFQEESDKVADNSAKPDPLIEELMLMAGLTATGMVNIPVVMDDDSKLPKDFLIELSTKVDTFALDWDDTTTAVGLLPDKDIADLEKSMARLAYKAAINYYTIKQIKDARELR